MTYNIIGSCPDLSKFQSDICEIERILKGAFDMKPVCILHSHGSVNKIEEMGSAHINLVLREEGKKSSRRVKRALWNTLFVWKALWVKRNRGLA